MELKFTTLTIITFLLFAISNFLLPQDQTTIPSPAPSKTPTPSDTSSRIDSTEIAIDIIEPYTQSDLNVLAGNVQRPNGITWHNDKLYTICNGDWTVYELNDTTGDTRTYIFGIRNGHTLYAESNDIGSLQLWIPDFETNSLMLINRTGTPQIITSNLNTPWGISVFDDEHFLVTSLTENSIKLISRTGDIIRSVDQFRSPTGIASQENTIYIANNGSTRRSIEWFNHDTFLGDETPEVRPLVSGLQNVTNIVLAPDNLLYFSYALGTRGVVGRINPEICKEQGGCSNDEVEIVVYTELAAPLAGLTISGDMRLFVHTIFRPEIYWLQLGG